MTAFKGCYFHLLKRVDVDPVLDVLVISRLNEVTAGAQGYLL